MSLITTRTTGSLYRITLASSTLKSWEQAGLLDINIKHIVYRMTLRLASLRLVNPDAKYWENFSTSQLLPPRSPLRKTGSVLFGEFSEFPGSTNRPPRRECLAFVPISEASLADRYTIGRLIQLTLFEHWPPASIWSRVMPGLCDIKDHSGAEYEE